MDKDIELPTIGEILNQEFLQEFGLSQSDVSKAIHVPRARISDIVNNKRSITADTDLRLTTFFGLSKGYFLRMQTRLEVLQAQRELEDVLSNIVPFLEQETQSSHV